MKKQKKTFIRKFEIQKLKKHFSDKKQQMLSNRINIFILIIEEIFFENFLKNFLNSWILKSIKSKEK